MSTHHASNRTAASRNLDACQGVAADTRLRCLRRPRHLALALVVTSAALSVILGVAAREADAQTYGTLTTIATFKGTANGANPYSNLTLDSNGDLYGTTFGGGAAGDGTVFQIAAGTDALTTIATFRGTTNGASPISGLTVDSNGNLYGTTQDGGASGEGTVFEIAAGTDTLTTLATLTGANGGFPIGGLTLDPSGNIYGTTYNGGANTDGTVFEIAAGTNTLSTLATFTGANGSFPKGGLTLDASGNLYGTTNYGGSSAAGQSGTVGYGTVFEIAAGTSAITTLTNFTGAGGGNPFSGVTLDSHGNLYGTTEIGGGGGSGVGTVFEIAAGTNTLTTLATFTGGASGGYPLGNLIIDSSGNIYGTNQEGGGPSSLGTVFEISAGTDELTTLATFFGSSNGGDPYGGLTMDSSGNLYGTTNAGGANGDGTVFEIPTIGGVGSASAPEPAALSLLLSLGLPAAFALVRRSNARI